MKLEDIRERVFAHRPRFGEVVRAHGSATLPAYYAEGFSNLMHPSSDLLDAVEQETAIILGPELGKVAREALAEQRWVNTADHHGLLCHPYFYTTALARSHAMVRKNGSATVTLPFGGVSLGNDSFPRGISLHDREGREERIFFKSLQERRMPVHSLAPMDRSTLVRERDRACSFLLSSHAQERLGQLLTSFLDDAHVWDQETYSAQLTAMNSVLWAFSFGTARGACVYLEIDSVVRRLLLQKHLCTDTVISALLFNPLWRQAFVELFTGVIGSHTKESGTHFFWYVDHRMKTRRRLVVHGDILITIEGDVVIPLTSEHIAEGVRTRSLMPSSALIMIIITGVEGLACGGGPSQLEYLHTMMEQWETLLQRFGKSVETPTTAIYCGDNALFQISTSGTNLPVLSTFLDVVLHSLDVANNVDTALESTPLAATVDALLPVLYHMYTKENPSYKSGYTIPTISHG